MGFIRFLLWTSMCIGLGIFVASYEVDGKTPAQHIKQIWKGVPALPLPDKPLEKVKKFAMPSSDRPTETHSDADRDAVNRIVAKRVTR